MITTGTAPAYRVGTVTESELPTTTRSNDTLWASSPLTVRPEIPIPPPLSLPEVPRFPMSVPPVVQMGGHGGDDAAMFSLETQVATPASAQFTAEHAIDFLSNLSHGLTETERCVRVQEIFRGIAADESLLSSELVGEAAQAIVSLRQELREIEENFQRNQADDEICIQVLEERLTKLRAQIKARQEGIGDQRQRLRVRLDEMMGVIVFFDRYQGFLRQELHASASTEIPSYLREDAVKNLLKHNGRLAFR